MRFSHLSEKILDSLNNKDLTKCRKVAKSWQSYLDKQKILHVRMIETKISKIHEVGNEWKWFFETANTEAIKDLRQVVDSNYHDGLDPKIKSNLVGNTPRIMFAWEGYLNYFKMITKKTKNVNPRRDGNGNGITPFHFAAAKGHFEVCKYIIENITNKNPAADDGITPLHTAAKKGHLDITQLILDQVENKNPKGPFIYYVSMFWAFFFDPPTHLASKNKILHDPP